MSSVATAVPLTASDSAVSRRLRITPSMCGQTSLFAGQIGDWAWDTVSRLCGTDVLTATNDAGSPTYLAFYYFRIRGTPRCIPARCALATRWTLRRRRTTSAVSPS